MQSLSEVFDYTYEEFGERQVRKLINQISKTTSRIAVFPHIGKVEELYTEEFGVEYRSIVVISEISLIYTILDDTIYIEYVKNARQDDETVWDKLSVTDEE